MCIRDSFREPYYSQLADKAPHSVWDSRGATTMEARAAGQVDKILERHRVEPLPEGAQKAIREIVRREQAQADERK